MAYKRIYKFTGQGNYAGSRVVNWSKFSVSGDTDKPIRQILSITYEHWHSSLGSPTRTLRGRITLADGTVFVSESTSHKFSGDVYKYTNVFTSLPTPEQFAQIAKIETINESGENNQTGYGDNKLYWRANSDYPMRVIVEFIDVLPTYYRPKVEEFVVGRCDASGADNPEGAYIMKTLKLSIGDREGLSKSPSVKIYYAQDAPATMGSPFVDVSSGINDLLSGVYKNTQIIPGEWALGSVWEFMVVFSVGEEAAQGQDSVNSADAPIFISDDKQRLSFGGFPKRTEGRSAEFHAPVYLYGGIVGVTNFIEGEVDTGGHWVDGKKIYLQTFMFKNVAVGSGTVTVTLGTMASYDSVDSVIEIRGTVHAKNQKEIYPIPRFWSTSAGTYSADIIKGGVIRLRVIGGYSPVNVALQIYYTKV